MIKTLAKDGSHNALFYICRDVKIILFKSPEMNNIDLQDLYLKVTTEAALGLIGGTMGLLTGFSILSGIEIIYYLLRCSLSLCATQ